MKRIAALYDDPENARRAVAALEDAGMAPERISFVARSPESDGEEAGKGETTGFGAMVGAGGGALAGVALAAMPGIGAVAAAGAVASALVAAAAGGTVGGLIGRFAEQQLSEHDAEVLAEGLRRGGAMVTADAEDGQADAVHAILHNAGAVDLEERRADYLGQGWQGFDERDAAWGVDEIRRERDGHTENEPPIAMPVLPVR
jgi:hypothetical protein